MNQLYKVYCRVYQFCFHAALPLLPYREPIKLKSTNEIAEELKKKKIQSVLLVTDEFLAKSEKCVFLEKCITDIGIHLEIYDKTLPNPTVNNVNEAKKLYLAGKCEALIAYGGGSSMDCAKAVGALIAYTCRKQNFYVCSDSNIYNSEFDRNKEIVKIKSNEINNQPCKRTFCKVFLVVKRCRAIFARHLKTYE